MVVIGQGWLIPVKVVVFVRRGYNLAEEVLFGQTGCMRAKVVVFGKN